MDRVQAAAEKNWQNVDNEVWNVREGCRKKMREKYGLLPNLPRTPPPWVWSFFQKKLNPIFFVENFIYNGQNKF